MRIKKVRLKNYKRFTELTIADLPETARLVVLVGPNGTAGGPTPARSAGSTPGSAAARSTTRPWPPTSPSLHDAGRASSSASMAVAAACFRAKLAGQPTPAGERTARVLAGYRRTASDRGRGQARPFGVSDLAAVLATCHRPRRRGRGVESDQVALERGRVDAVIAGLLFMAGMRRSEVSALRWADVVDSTDGDGFLVTVRRSKTNQEGEVNDVRFVKDGVARALRTLRASTSPEPSDRVVPLSAQMIGLRFTAAALAAGVESRVTAHSGRVGLASELTSRGASTTDVMLAGNWKTSRMVAHYSAGATAERGAVARYL